MVDHSAVGRTFDTFTMPVERGKIREFARATMSRNEAYLDGEQPVSEPTFLMTAAFWSGSVTPTAELGIDVKRLLHGGQEFTFFGPPPRAGTNLTGTPRVDNIYEKEGRRGGTMTFIELITEFRDEHEQLVAESKITLIETAKAPTEGEK